MRPGQRQRRRRPNPNPNAHAAPRCASLLDDHRVLVEPACGAALALLYSERQRAALAAFDPLVVVVCGGSGVDWEIMAQWRADFLPGAK